MRDLLLYALGVLATGGVSAIVAYRLGQRNMRRRLNRTLTRAGSRFSGDDL